MQRSPTGVPCLVTVVLVMLAAVLHHSEAAGLDLTLLHTNDVHARFEQFDKYGGSCSTEESDAGECFGGVARRRTKVSEIRAAEDNVLLLDGGDQFQGTMWFYLYKGQATSHFMNAIGYDAMAIGNHEFDNTPAGLRQFLLDLNAPVISSNIDASLEPSINGLFNKSVVLTVGGEKIGIVGFTYSLSNEISSTGQLKFSDEITSVQAEVDRLIAEYNVNKIIALGHSGHPVDLQIAKKVRGVDVVIGGHTNTFLYTGTPPSTEVPVGEYPVVVRPDGDPSGNVLVVQAYTTGKYLGRLDVSFDDDGKLTSWGGNPILLDKDVARDPAVLKEVEEWAESVRNLSNVHIGTSHVKLDGDCRLGECNLGNLIADAYIREEVKFPDELRWNDVSIALVNGGSVRTSLPRGDINVGEVNTVLPFGNTVDTITIKGVHLLEALENSVAQYDPISKPGRFLQFSGMLVSYDMSKPPGSRVVSADARCTECEIPSYEPVDPEKEYKVVLPSFLATGGDGFTMIGDNLIEHEYGSLDASVLADYISSMTPLTTGLDRRITFVESTEDPCGTGTANSQRPSVHILLMCSFIVCLRLLFKTD